MVKSQKNQLTKKCEIQTRLNNNGLDLDRSIDRQRDREYINIQNIIVYRYKISIPDPNDENISNVNDWSGEQVEGARMFTVGFNTELGKVTTIPSGTDDGQGSNGDTLF